MKLTTLCYIRRGNEYLMLYRNKKKEDPNAGKWVGVGGKFEDGETPDECMLREVYEETGLVLTKYHFHGVVSFLSDIWENEYMFLYTGTEFTGEQKECTEGTLSWIPEEKIPELRVWEGDRIFLRQLLEKKERIDLKLEYHGEKLVAWKDTISGEQGNIE